MASATNSDHKYSIIILDSSDQAKGTETVLTPLCDSITILTEIGPLENHINGIPANREIILIITGHLGAKHQADLSGNKYSRIESIYVYCRNKGAHQRWASTIAKIKGVHTTPEELLEGLRQNHSFPVRAKTPPSAPIVPQATSNTTVANNFELCFETKRKYWVLLVLTNHLLQMPATTGEKDLFARTLTAAYPNDSEVAGIIREFLEIYSSDLAIKWIRRHSCVSSVLSTAFRTRNPEELLACVVLLRDLFKQVRTEPQATQTEFYYAAVHGRDQVEQLKKNQGKYAELSSFPLANTDRDAALTSAKLAQGDQIRVLYIIKTDPNINGIVPSPRAVPLSSTEKRNSQQVLLMLGSLFKVDKFEEKSKDMVEVHLNLCDLNDDPSDRKYFDRYKQRQINGNACTALQYFHLVFEIGMELHDDFFEKFARDAVSIFGEAYSDDSSEKTDYYDAWSSVKSYEKSSDEVIECCNKSLERKRKKNAQPEQNWIANYQHLGRAYLEKGDLTKALNNLSEGLRILKKLSPEADYRAIHFYRMLGSVRDQQDRRNEAQSNYYHALAECLDCYPEDHEILCSIYDALARCCQGLQQYRIALSFTELSLTKKKLLYAEDSSTVAEAYVTAGLLHRDLNEIDQARENFERAQEIYGKLEPPGGINYTRIQELIDELPSST